MVCVNVMMLKLRHVNKYTSVVTTIKLVVHIKVLQRQYGTIKYAEKHTVKP